MAVAETHGRLYRGDIPTMRLILTTRLILDHH